MLAAGQFSRGSIRPVRTAIDPTPQRGDLFRRQSFALRRHPLVFIGRGNAFDERTTGAVGSNDLAHIATRQRSGAEIKGDAMVIGGILVVTLLLTK